MGGEALAIASLAACQLVVHRLRFTHYLPRSRWLSFAGGMAIAYVFAHLLPELSARQYDVARSAWLRPLALDEAIYLMAMVGLIGFYGLAHFAEHVAKRGPPDTGDPQAHAGVFWLNIGAFALYNLLIGYLVHHREDPNRAGLLLFTVAMLCHIVVNDFGLRRLHGDHRERVGRWLLALTIVVGWLIGLQTRISAASIGLLYGFLSGGIILNTMKEEVPPEHQSHFLPFVGGAVAYTILLLTI